MNPVNARHRRRFNVWRPLTLCAYWKVVLIVEVWITSKLKLFFHMINVIKMIFKMEVQRSSHIFLSGGAKSKEMDLFFKNWKTFCIWRCSLRKNGPFLGGYPHPCYASEVSSFAGYENILTFSKLVCCKGFFFFLRSMTWFFLFSGQEFSWNFLLNHFY